MRPLLTIPRLIHPAFLPGVLIAAALTAPGAQAAPRKATLATAAPAPATQPNPPAWNIWVDRLGRLLADPALARLDHASLAPFFQGVIELPAADLAACKSVTAYQPHGTPFATAVSAILLPETAPCAERSFGRLGFAVDDRTGLDTDTLVQTLTSRLGAPAVENVWFPQTGGHTISGVRYAWQVGLINVVAVLEPEESNGLVGFSIIRGVGPTRPALHPAEPPLDPNSFEAMINRMFQ